MSFKITWRFHAISIILSYMLICCLIDTFTLSFFSLIYYDDLLKFTNNLLINYIVFALIFIVPIAIIHELLHGIFYSLFGGKVKFGIKGLNVFCQEISGVKLHRTKFLIVLLAPITVISLLSLLLPHILSSIVVTINLIGSTGDLLMSLYLVRLSNDTYILDRSYGFDVIKS